MDPACLELELTESTFMTDVEESVAILGRLKSLGIRLAIDDFGTGYSSLNRLRWFPIDRLKIDQSFIREICTNPEGAAIVEAIIALAHALRLTVLAEGVETAAQLAFLKSRNCGFAQGFFFSRALPAEEAAERFSELPLVLKPLPLQSAPR